MMNKNITEISLMNKEYTILYSKYLFLLKKETTDYSAVLSHLTFNKNQYYLFQLKLVIIINSFTDPLSLILTLIKKCILITIY